VGRPAPPRTSPAPNPSRAPPRSPRLAPPRSGNQLSGALPPALGAAPALQELDLSGNAFSGPLPPAWAPLAAGGRLRYLAVYGNAKLAGCVPAALLEAVGTISAACEATALTCKAC
jgi:hypothetical protein